MVPGSRISVARGLCAAALAACGLARPLPALANCQVEVLELPVKMVGSRAVATVGINGVAVPLTVDSGAFFSMLTDAAAAQLGLRVRRADGLNVWGIAGKVEARMTTVDKLELLKGDFPGVQFVVGGNEPGAGTMGLMGRNMLAVGDAEYDLAHGAIRFLFPKAGCDGTNMAYWAGSSPVSEVELIPDYHSKTPEIRAKVKLNGTELTALFDTGFPSTVVTARAARRIGIREADMTPSVMFSGAGRGRANTWTARFDQFAIGGEVISNNVLRVADIDVEQDMLLGIDFFLSHRIYVSKSQSKMFFTYNGGPVFALGRRETASATQAEPSGDDEATSADQLARRGAASAARRDFESALADLNQACALEPTSAAFLAQRGFIQDALRHPVQAREDFDRALALDPAQFDARVRRAALRLNAKDRDGAKEDLDALDRMLAPQAQMRIAMARLYSNLEQPAQALAQLDQWLTAHPSDIQRDAALNSRCWARLQLGIDLDRALDDCDDAVGEYKNLAYLDTRGWAYLRLGKYAKALSDFDRSIEYRPRTAWALYGRGLTKKRMGDAAQGDADLAAARAIVPDIDQRVTKSGVAPNP